MRKGFSNVLSVDQFKYTAASFSLTDFSRWVTDPMSVTMYLTATGVSDEGELNFISWERWRLKYGRGSQTANRPIEYTITPALEFAVGPKPDLVYTVLGEHYQGNQRLASDDDTPNCPARFHDVITWKALKKLKFTDEDQDGIRYAEDMLQPLRFALERDQLPKMEIAASATLA